jgi:cyclin K
MATGVVFFHRFYMFHSFNEFPRYVIKKKTKLK